MARTWFDPELFLEWLKSEWVVHSDSGTEIISTCPECGSEKLWINRESGRLICYRCNFGGSLYDLLASAAGIERSEARKILGIDKEKPVERADEAESIFQALEQAGVSGQGAPDFQPFEFKGARWFGVDDACCQAEAEFAGQALAALYRRGFTWEEITRYRAGWCWQGDERWKGRVILPVFVRGVLAWGQAWNFRDPKDKLKYRNPNNEEAPFRRKELIYGIEDHPTADTLAVVEGMFNRWAVEQAGCPAVCTFGKTVSEEQLVFLVRHPARKFLIGLDSDAVSEAAALRGRLQGHGKEALLCRLPEGKDWNDLTVVERQGVLHGAGGSDWLFG